MTPPPTVPNDAPADTNSGWEETLRALYADRRRALVWGIATLAASVALVMTLRAYGRSMRGYVRGERTLEGEPAYTPEHEVSDEALAAIDFERVHSRLMPAWTIALASATSPYWTRQADARFEDLAAAVGADPNLQDLLRRTHQDLRDDPVENAHRLDYRLWAYNEYLDQRDIPWRVEAALVLGRQRAIFHTLSYEVMADAETEEGHRVRLLRRADRTNSLEGWLGKTGRDDEGAMVLLRRVLHFTVRHVWPGLHPALDGRRPLAERSWLAPMRREVSDQLDPDTMRLLAETAVDQQALIETAAAVEARALCGSRFTFHGLPYNGLSPRSVHALYRALARSRDNTECPEVTVDEAARVIGASERLASTPGLEDAIERLAMVVARAIAVHELRHVADGDELACPGCPEGLDGLARDEVSAYLTAFSDPYTGYLSLLQACSRPPSPTLHGEALGAVLEALLPLGCEGPPHPMMKSYAQMLEGELFGERPRVQVPTLPDRVALLPRARRSSGPRPEIALEQGPPRSTASMWETPLAP
ncbi:MAG: hypothetical protein AB8I08_17230 [Sandaracinaceae bacterium]